ncbi:alcohol dehydrogenase catalytic domain-containing protein [Pantoea agglomerans]|uniref:zinc-dependent alcohol dehydrogenase n=1 Tax=Pantoea TaxID=53335 RepID=UPI003208B91B
MKTMKAINLVSPKETALVTIPVPETPKDGLLLKTKCVSICSTDISYFEGYLYPSEYPIIMGHEFLGEVVEIGEEYKDNNVKIGDRIVYWGQTDFGGFAEYRTLRPIFSGQVKKDEFWTDRYFWDDHHASAVKIPDDMDDLVAPLIEPTTAAMRAILTHPPKPGDKVLVLGTGPIGIIAGQIIKKVFAPHSIVSMDNNPMRNEHAEKFFSEKAYLPEEITEMVENNTFDYVFDGLPTIKNVDEECDPRRIAMRKIVPRGQYLLYGASQAMQKFDNWLMLSKGINISSAPFDVQSFPMHKTANVIQSALQMIHSGVVDAKGLISTVCPFEDYDRLVKIFETYRSTTQLKTVVDFR